MIFPVAGVLARGLLCCLGVLARHERMAQFPAPRGRLAGGLGSVRTAVWTEHKGGDIVTHCRDEQEQSVLCLRILVQVDLRLSGVA